MPPFSDDSTDTDTGDIRPAYLYPPDRALALDRARMRMRRERRRAAEFDDVAPLLHPALWDSTPEHEDMGDLLIANARHWWMIGGEGGAAK